jgi:hypothetical protein
MLDEEIHEFKSKEYKASFIFSSSGPVILLFLFLKLDLALIKISNSNDNFNFISIENSPSLDPGQIVFIVGYPLFNPKNGISGSITKGFFFF